MNYYDIECFPNFWSVIFMPANTPASLIDEYVQADIDNKLDIKLEIRNKINPIIYEISSRKNELIDIYKYINKDPLILCGYNNIKYDDVFLKLIIANIEALLKDKDINNTLYLMSQLCINLNEYAICKEHLTKRELFRYQSANFYTYDLGELNQKGMTMVSLKQCMINLKWYRIQDLPFKFDEVVPEDRFDDILDYNFNDVLGTRLVFINVLPDIKMRRDIGRVYGVDVHTDSKSKIGDKLLIKYYTDISGKTANQLKNLRTYRSSIKVSDIISPMIKFNSKELNDFLAELKELTLHITKLPNGKEHITSFDRTLIYNGTAYTFAKGGLHSKDRGGVFKSDDKFVIIDVDGDSFYPNYIRYDKVCPKHLDVNHYLTTVNVIVDDRIEAKYTAKDKSITDVNVINDAKAKADGLKIVINSQFFGKLGYDGWLLDRKAFYQVTFNCQLLMLMLVEFINDIGIKVISVNTDGVTSKIPIDRVDEFRAACDKWVKHTNITIEENIYDLYVRTSINHYMAKIRDGKIKYKGDWDSSINLAKGFSSPIIKIAITKYYLDGTPIMDTLKSHTDIYDFCISTKSGISNAAVKARSADPYFKPQLHKLSKGEKIVTPVQRTIRYFVCKNSQSYLFKFISYKGDRGQTINKYNAICAKKQVQLFNDYFHKDDIKDYHIDYGYYSQRCIDLMNTVNNVVTAKAKNQAGSLFNKLEF